MKDCSKKEMNDMASKTIESTEVRTKEAHQIFFDMINNPADVNEYTRNFFEEYIKKMQGIEGEHDNKRNK